MVSGRADGGVKDLSIRTMRMVRAEEGTPVRKRCQPAGGRRAMGRSKHSGPTPIGGNDSPEHASQVAQMNAPSNLAAVKLKVLVTHVPNVEKWIIRFWV
jgi:hypothetical protein